MSCDFAFWESDEPLENDGAGEIYKSLVEHGRSNKVQPSAKIALLLQEIRTRWPEPPTGREDEWPFAAPPDSSEAHVIVSIVPSRLWDVWPHLGDFAKRHELVMYDPQQSAAFLPPRLSRKRTRLRAQKKRGERKR